jgi:hypothetical protein
VAQSNGTNIWLFINGVVYLAAGTAISGTAFVSPSQPLVIGQQNSQAPANFAIAKARLVFGNDTSAGSKAAANVYSSGNFTANPNFAAVPAGATVAWQLESQYPLPTYPSFFDVPQLPQQIAAYGAEPVVVGGVTSNVLSPYSTTYPQLDSIRFDGTGYIDYGNAASSVLTTNIWASNWTIEGWVYPTVAAGNVFARSNLATGVDLSLSLSGGTVNFSWGSSSLTGPAISLNQWTHIAATYDGTRANVYAGGTGTSTGTLGSLPFTPSYGVQIGGPTLFTGNLADVRVSNVARYTGSSYTVPSAPFSTDSSTLLLLKSLGGQVGTTLEVQGRGLGSTSIGATQTVRAYPPAPMSSYLLDTTSNVSVTYGQGKYVASASSEQVDRDASRAFDFQTGSGRFWQSNTLSANYQTSSPYGYTGSVRTVDTLGNSYAGEWIQLQLPVSVLLQSYNLQTDPTYNSSTFYVLGSRDGINWTLVNSQSGITTSSTTFAIGATQAYNYFRLVTGALGGNGGSIVIRILSFSGTEESLCVTSDAKVGVGIANPQRALEVAGDLVVSGTISGGAGLGSFRNRIINGDMRIDQRNAGASFIVTAGAGSTYTLDRWFGWPILGSKFSVQQTSVVPLGLGFKNSVLVTSLSGVAALTGYYYGFGQYIEGYNIADLNWGTSYGTPVTVSFWVRSSIAGSYCLQLGGAVAFLPSYIVQYTVSAADTWQQIVSTIPPPPNGYTANFPSTTAASLRLWWDLGSSDATYGGAAFGWVAADKLRVPGTTSLLATYGATMYLTGVQLEKGTVATPFEFRPYATELQLCQRYYWNFSSAGGVYTGFGSGYTNGTSALIIIPFPVQMRAQPTQNSNSAMTTFVVLSTGASVSPSALTTFTTGLNSSILTFTVAGQTAGQGAILQANNTTVAFFGFSAEL